MQQKFSRKNPRTADKNQTDSYSSFEKKMKND